MNKSHIEFEFSIGHCNGSMRLQAFVDDVLTADHAEIEDDKLILNFDVNWPCRVRFCVSEKNQLLDTKIDSEGKIVADKYVKLERISVDRVAVAMPVLYSLSLETQTQTIKSSYWGFNGTVDIDFDEENSFMWHLKQIPFDNSVYDWDRFRKI